MSQGYFHTEQRLSHGPRGGGIAKESGWRLLPGIDVRFTALTGTVSGMLLFLSLLTALVLPRPSWAQKTEEGPNFGNVTDILGGQRSLLSVDDLVFGSKLFDINGSKVTKEQTAPDTGFDRKVRGEISAHMFAGSGDVVVYTTTNKVIVYDPRTKKSLSLPMTDALNFTTSLCKGDFAGDGYDDVVIGSFTGVRVLSVVDRNDFDKGLRVGELRYAPHAYQPNAVGDFSGHGRKEIAQIVKDVEGDLFLFSVDPVSLHVSQIGQWISPELPSVFGERRRNLAAGHFLSTTKEELLFGKTGTPGQSTLRTTRLFLLDFDKSVRPTVRDTKNVLIEENQRTLLQSGHLDPNSPFDQVVQIVEGQVRVPFNTVLRTSIRVLTFKGNKIVEGPEKVKNFGVYNFALGNFDRLENGRPTLGQQVALVTGKLEGNGFLKSEIPAAVNIFNITITPTPDGDQIGVSDDPISDYALGNSRTKPFEYIPLVAGDLQGRSVGVGTPFKITVSRQIRPDVVLSLPPMHVDYVKPYRTGEFPHCKTTTQPCEVNISVLPGSFRTTFASSNTQETSSLRKSTTSYGYGTELGAGASTLIGNVLASNFQASYKYAFKTTYDKKVATANSKFGAVTDSLSSTTGFADHLLYTRERFNIWVYPIMGLKVCPGKVATCADSEKTQAYVEYSAPDEVKLFDIDATTQDWYQPVNEPGNIFSYPWSVALFEQTYPSAGLVTSPPRWRGIDTSESSYTTSWDTKSGKDVSVGATTTTTHDHTVTTSATVGIFEVATGTISFNSNYNRSSGLETLDDSTVALSTNRGLTVDKPAFSSEIATQYGYSFAGFVYANRSPVPPPERPQVIAADGNPAQLQTRGPLMSAFLANLNPGDENVGSFWKEAYDKPDIALNHPARWSWNKTTGDVTFNQKTSEDPIRQEFYWMKGLYITPAGAEGMGPQRQETTAGEPLQLQARVYNYSLTAVPADNKVRVEFYGQLVDKVANKLTGSAFRINGVTLPAIPGFKSRKLQPKEELQPNWALASTVFDPRQFEQTRNGNVYLAFWVVAWYENPAGKKGEEVADHGLMSTPGKWSQISEVKTEAYSNNVGLYGAHTPLYIAPAEPASASGPVAQVAPESADSIVLESMTGAAEHTAMNSKVTVSATLHNQSAQMGSQFVAFYDGDPAAGTKPFEVQDVPIIPPGDSYTVSASLRPETPGVHTLYAVAGPGTPSATMQSETITVDQ